MLGVEPYVLRYWEGEFERLAPRKTKSGQRSYQRHDIELLHAIRELLYTEMFTIAGARRQLELRDEQPEGEAAQASISAAPVDDEALEGLRAELEEARQARASAERELEEVRVARDALAVEHDELQQLHLSMRAQLEERARQIEEELSAALQARAQFEGERDALQRHTVSLEADLEQLVQEQRRQSRALDETWEQMSAPLEEEIARLQGELSVAQEQLSALRASHDTLQAQLKATSRDRRSLFAALREELQHLAGLAEAPN